MLKLFQCLIPTSSKVHINVCTYHCCSIKNILQHSFLPYICATLLVGVTHAIKREVRCKSGAIPVAVSSW
jgi:hypothetical protein